ncbi:MAG TPA: S-layer homology domain-containing protein [Metalysinibacillus jejuensis]|uniref:S-layer homology domain-containing protein n=1 Tax=Metalysinibacillus jejuensis TaxID=914327 RepID=A0A921T676_9BACL|nr:S-layer homology domain-containing protein [Metalysinibacillus jejuensis]
MKKLWLSLLAGTLFMTAPSAQAASPLHEYAEVFTGEVAILKDTYRDFPGAKIEVPRFERFASTTLVHIDRGQFLAADKTGLPEEDVALISLVLASTNPSTKITLEITTTIEGNTQTMDVAVIRDGTVMHKGEPTVTPLKRYSGVINPSFTDISHHPNAPAIYRLARLGIVTSTKNQFNPGDPITRAQFAAMLYRTIPNTAPFKDNPFTDITTHWAKDDIVTMYAFDVVKGLTKFNPGNAITRAQAAVMIARYLDMLGIDLTQIPRTSPFEDVVKLHSENQEAIGLMYQLGIINGTSPTTFNPGGQLTRAQMAKILDGILYLPIDI